MTVHTDRWQFSVNDYHRMRETGILTEEHRVELIDGEVRTMSPIGPFHAAIVKRLTHILSRLLPDTALLSVQDPIQLSMYAEPQPDLAVLRFREDFYAQQHPNADDVLLIIEVADTSAVYDRTVKVPRYAAAGVPEVWLVDVGTATIEQYTYPRMDQYGTKQTYERGMMITATTVDSVQLAVDAILGG